MEQPPIEAQEAGEANPAAGNVPVAIPAPAAGAAPVVAAVAALPPRPLPPGGAVTSVAVQTTESGDGGREKELFPSKGRTQCAVVLANAALRVKLGLGENSEVLLLLGHAHPAHVTLAHVGWLAKTSGR